ncbi:MAG TPA: hypothetical protein VFA26_17005 [Gemmataceae bacterium]|nr:hypothetical protein [Gemmataceae bacterium]
MDPIREKDPGEHLVRLLKGLLVLIVAYLLFTCCSCCGLGSHSPWQVLDYGWERQFARTTGLGSPVVVQVLLMVPGLLVVPLSVVGAILARSPSSRLLFIGTGALGVLLPLTVLALMLSMS